MKIFNLALGFKGERDYIHGTDMLNASTEQLARHMDQKLEHICFVIHKMTNRNLVLKLISATEVHAPSDCIIADIKFTCGDQAWAAILTETQLTPEYRYEYDEGKLEPLIQIDFDNRSINLQEISPFSAIETIVALNKALHIAVLPKPEGSSWVFCRWDSPAWPLPENLKGVTVSLKQALGTRLTRSDVSLDGKLLGQVYFSAKPAK